MSTTRNRGVAGGVDLDGALAPPPGPSVYVTDAALTDVVVHAREIARTDRASSGLPRRRRWAAPLVVGGVVALTGAGTTAAYQLSVPPFQGLDAGTERTTTGIPVDYVNYRHRSVHCLAFIEFADVSAAQRQQINALAAGTHWGGYGQRIINTVPASKRTTLEQDVRALDALGPDLTRRAVAALLARPLMCTVMRPQHG